jgi:hypothetical protein
MAMVSATTLPIPAEIDIDFLQADLMGTVTYFCSLRTFVFWTIAIWKRAEFHSR